MKGHLLDLAAELSSRDSAETAYHRALSENEALRRHMRHMVREAEHNESSLRRIQSIEPDLLNCGSLASLLSLLMLDARSRCDWDRVSFLLYDPEHEMRRLLAQGGQGLAVFGDLVFTDTPQRLDALHGLATDAFLTPAWLRRSLGPIADVVPSAAFSSTSTTSSASTISMVIRQGTTRSAVWQN